MKSAAFNIAQEGVLARRVDEVPDPRAGEALVRMGATSVNFHDLLNVQGRMGRLPLPRVPFSDGCGEVLAVGEGVRRVAVGDRVIPSFFPRWLAGPPTPDAVSVIRGDHVDGCLREFASFDADGLVRAPPHLSDVEAATLGCAGLTAWRSLMVEGRVAPGDVVVVQGTGGVSLFALGFAKLAGATVIAISSSDEKLERCRGLGADHLINYRSTPEWAKAVMAVTDGRGADYILNVGGPETLAQAVAAAQLGGFVAIIGVLTGAHDLPFPLWKVMAKNLTLKGLTVGSRQSLEDMCRAVEASRYVPVIGRSFGFDEAHAAMALMESQGHFGKIAIRIGQ